MKYRFVQFLNSVILLTLCLATSLAHAIDIESPKFRVNGFGTLGLTKANNDSLSTRNTVGQEGIYDEWSMALDSRIGLQLDYLATDKLKLSTQFVVAERPENNLRKSIHSAYLAYAFSPSFELRVGRAPTGFLMLSDYMHVGYAQLWAHVPAEFYGLSSFDYGDGIDLVHTTSVLGGELRSRIWLNKSQLRLFNNSGLTDVDAEPTYGVVSDWNNGVWSFSLAYATLSFSERKNQFADLQNGLRAITPLWSKAADYIDEFSVDDTEGHFYGFSIGYNRNGWLIRTEFNLATTETFNNDTHSAYALVGHRFGNVTPFIMGAMIKNDRVFIETADNAFAVPTQQLVQSIADYYHYNQKTLSLGLRWDIKPKVALKAQWDHTWIAPYGGNLNLYRVSPNVDDETTDRFTVTLDFVF